MDTAQETEDSGETKQQCSFLHVRESWEALQRQDTLMLHSVCDDEGSGWSIEPRPGGVELMNKRSGRYLHVRNRWAEEDLGAGNLLMMHEQAGLDGNLWIVEELGLVPGPILLRSVKAGGRCLMVRQTEWASKSKGEMLTLSAAPQAGGGYPDEERPTCHWRIEPQESGDGQQCWIAFKSATRSVAHFSEGKKFDGDGHWKSSRGWSVVADLAEPDRFLAGRELVEQSFAWRMCLSDTLPISSLHMTVCGHDWIGKIWEGEQRETKVRGGGGEAMVMCV
jgi:hypothetical protein